MGEIPRVEASEGMSHSSICGSKLVACEESPLGEIGIERGGCVPLVTLGLRNETGPLSNRLGRRGSGLGRSSSWSCLLRGSCSLCGGGGGGGLPLVPLVRDGGGLSRLPGSFLGLLLVGLSLFLGVFLGKWEGRESESDATEIIYDLQRCKGGSAVATDGARCNRERQGRGKTKWLTSPPEALAGSSAFFFFLSCGAVGDKGHTNAALSAGGGGATLDARGAHKQGHQCLLDGLSEDAAGSLEVLLGFKQHLNLPRKARFVSRLPCHLTSSELSRSGQHAAAV